MAVVTAVTGGRMGPRGGIHPNQGLEDYVSASPKPIKGKENLDTTPPPFPAPPSSAHERGTKANFEFSSWSLHNASF